MAFKKQFFLIVLVILILSIIFSSLLYLFKKSTFTEYEITHRYEQRKNEFHSIINARKTLLVALADSLVQNHEVHRAYLNDDRNIIIDNFEDMWKTFQKSNLVSEIHFFKSKTTSFVNFSNTKKYNMDVKDIRQDIDWVASTFIPSTHFLVCRLFPGLRATYPIVIDNTLYGSVSLGIDLDKINTHIQEMHPDLVSYFILNDEKLKSSLLSEKYEAHVQNHSDLNEFKVFGTDKNLSFIDLSKNYISKDGILYSIFAIKDFQKQTIGYFIFEDTLENFIDVLFNYTLLYIFMFLFIGLLSVFIFWILLNNYNKDIDNILSLLKSLNAKDFKSVHEKKYYISSKYKELQNIQDKIFETSSDIEMYIELLSKEIQDYSDQAFNDVLTDTFNRRALEDIGNKMLIKNKLAFKTTAAIILDIDNFKIINDTHGHSIGDAVLKQLSATIKHLLRKDDLFVRYGGEEFVILLPQTDLSNASEVAEKIRREIANQILDINGLKITYTVSLGVSESSLSDISLDELIKEADEKLYKAKNNGKNCVVI